MRGRCNLEACVGCKGTLHSCDITRLARSAVYVPTRSVEPGRVIRDFECVPSCLAQPTDCLLSIDSRGAEAVVRFRRDRPLPVIRSARRSPCHRPVSKYSRHRPTAARRDPFSKAVAHGLAALVDIRCRPYVRSSISRTGTIDPLRTAERENPAHESGRGLWPLRTETKHSHCNPGSQRAPFGASVSS
jgi:hypothetical protein